MEARRYSSQAKALQTVESGGCRVQWMHQTLGQWNRPALQPRHGFSRLHPTFQFHPRHTTFITSTKNLLVVQVLRPCPHFHPLETLSGLRSPKVKFGSKTFPMGAPPLMKRSENLEQKPRRNNVQVGCTGHMVPQWNE